MSQPDDACIDGRPIADLKVVELRHELEIRNLPKSGKKNELADRLRNYLLSNEEDSEQKANEDNANSYKEYRSLTEVRPVSKSPTKSPLKSPVSNVSSGNESPSKAVESSKTSEGTPPPAGDETFHTAHDETADFDESPKKENKTKEVSQDKTNDEENISSTEKLDTPINVIESEKEVDTTNVIEEPTLPDDNGEQKPFGEKPDVAPTEEKQHHDEDVIDMNVHEDELDMVDMDQHVKGEDELDYEEDVKKSERSGSEPVDKEDDVDDEKVKNDTSNCKLELTESKTDEEKEIKSEQNGDADDSTTPEGFIRRRAVSPARNKPTQFLHVRNLKRPFTVKTLKELFENFGEISSDEFWIDSIKTNCIVKYANVEQAELARSRLHHVVWPLSSSTSLLVEYTNEEKLARRRGDNVPSSAGPPTNITIVVENKRDDASATLEKRDQGKLYVESNKRKLDETSKKSLDDLFKKTVAKPPVYYLPLSESEAERRWADRLKTSAVDRSNGNGDSGRRRYDDVGGRREGSPSRKRERRESPVRRRH